jgi:molybdopterin synthase sulfur carrier subunit
MNLTILYFASLRETVGTGRERLELPPQVHTVAQLRAHLAARGESWGALGAGRNLRCAVNQQIADLGAELREGDEVAFFPPVTGG